MWHNALRAGSTATDCEIEHILNSLHWLFKDAPARCEDLKTLTGCTLLPKKFCQHRWLENVPVMDRALEIWPCFKQYVEAVKKGKVPTPKCKSFHTIAECCGHELFVVKGNIFLCIAKELLPFLTKYQTDKPMLPFLQGNLLKVLTALMNRFGNDETVRTLHSSIAFMKSDLQHASLHKEMGKVDIGFIAEKSLKDMYCAKKCTDKDVFSIRAETK